jgi:L-2-aminoadipate reductase
MSVVDTVNETNRWPSMLTVLAAPVDKKKASGATLSILDPAYPPARQQIYLEVAQPSALVFIGRATDEAGPLAPTVRKYVDTELKLKAEVPSLRLRDDGFLSGGGVGGKDLFDQVRPKATSPPDILVGPDSVSLQCPPETHAPRG